MCVCTCVLVRFFGVHAWCDCFCFQVMDALRLSEFEGWALRYLLLCLSSLLTLSLLRRLYNLSLWMFLFAIGYITMKNVQTNGVYARCAAFHSDLCCLFVMLYCIAYTCTLACTSNGCRLSDFTCGPMIRDTTLSLLIMAAAWSWSLVYFLFTKAYLANRIKVVTLWVLYGLAQGQASALSRHCIS